MTSKWRPYLFCAAGVLVAAVLSGCGGVNASHSVSPASMLIPGLIQAPVEEPVSEAIPIEFDESIEISSYQLVLN